MLIASLPALVATVFWATVLQIAHNLNHDRIKRLELRLKALENLTEADSRFVGTKLNELETALTRNKD